MNLASNGAALDVLRGVGVVLLEGLAIKFVGQTLFLFIAMWLMIKVQKLHCNPFALLGCAALACALDCIPLIGIPLSVIALILCLTKAIGARTFTDAIFTAGISYALTFCFNLFVLSMLMGNLRMSAQVRARTADFLALATNLATNFNTNSVRIVRPRDATSTSAPTNETATAAVNRDAARPAAPVKTYSPQAGKLAGDVATHFTIKGISKGPVQTMAMIGNGAHNYDVLPGDAFQMETAAGKASVVCDDVEENRVVLEVEGVRVVLLHK